MFAENLKYLREQSKIEQIELAHKLGRKSSSSISEWEKGKYTPKIGILNDIAEIFDVTITDLMNADLSNKNNENDLDILSIYAKLNKENQRATFKFAKERLIQQKKDRADDFFSTC